MILVVDNGSVYTNSIIDSLREIKISFEKITFDRINKIDQNHYSSFILSGRRQNISLMNAVNSKLIKHAVDSQKPLLGICYGAEILAITLGGTIRKMSAPRQGIYEVNVERNNSISQGTIKVFESHSYKVATLDQSFIRIASSIDCQFEIFQYKNQHIFGTQFHPEMSNDGRMVLQNFTSIK